MSKYELVRKKRDEMRNRRLDRINSRTFPPNRYQIDLGDMIQPEIVIDVEENEPLMIAHLPITDEMINDDISSSDDMQIQIEKPVLITKNLFVPGILLVEEPTISPEMIAQAEDIRKLILLQETIKRFSKKRSNVVNISNKCQRKKLLNGSLV